MSLQLRRFAAVCLTVLAVSAGATVASASAQPPQPVTLPAADGIDGYPSPDHHRQPPLHFGPFEIPRSGTVSGGFSWGVRD
ncbi:hypothetical protein ACIOKD_38225 [Streptomyces sp. NPDC087844]|uniref:hypothetical protein n=1 Tax=Streptomyces sp. NPDC087844 TaxID=3365805 RepID=UPI00382999A5